MHFFYILDERGNPVPEPDSSKWEAWFQADKGKRLKQCRVAQNYYVGDTIWVSTVFLAFDSALDADNPVLWETMVFADDSILEKLLDLSGTDERRIISKVFGGVDIQRRYHSREEAEQGHKQMCGFIEVCLAENLLPLSEK